MRRFLPLILLAGLAAQSPATPWDSLQHRSISRSHQFVVYSDDVNARAAIAMAAEDAKDKFLHLLESTDNWKRPIVIELTTADAADPGEPPSDVRIIDTEDGFKVNLNIVLGSDPAAAHFPQQLIRALLLEFAYRDQPALVQTGAQYAEPPPWLIEGFAALATDPDPADDSGLFQSLIASGKTPSLADFLTENPSVLDTPSRRLYSACAMSLVRLLLDLPDGRSRMRDFIRHWPGPNADPEAELLKGFPALNTGGQSLEKWWTVGLASQSAADRYQGLSLTETCDQLDAILKFDVVMDKSGKTKTFTLDQYPEFRKAPGATAALNNVAIRLIGLEAQAHPLMREVVTAYEDLTVRLARHRPHHLESELAGLAEYRRQLTSRMDQIADYLNWYEATQQTQMSGSFDEYMRTADQMDKDTGPDPTRSDPITKYMDSVEQGLSQ